MTFVGDRSKTPQYDGKLILHQALSVKSVCSLLQRSTVLLWPLKSWDLKPFTVTT